MRIPVSLWVSALTLAGIQAGVVLMDRSLSPAGTKYPKRALSELPLQLGPWQGKSVDLDPYIFRRLGAQSSINRVYRDAMGREVVLHVAMWPSDALQVPHPPQICYETAGFEIVKTSDYRLADRDPAESTAQLMLLQRDGQQACILFWYQYGDWTIVDRDGIRRTIWRLRGRTHWPPLIKVLLQISEPQADKAQEVLGSLAKPVLAWLRDLE